MTYELRPYQREAVDLGVRFLLAPQPKRLAPRHGIIVAPTGSGKSLVIANIVAALDGPTVVFQPTKEILEQNAAKLAAYGYRPAIFSASVGRKEVGEITLATIGSVARAPEAFTDTQYVLADECHTISAKNGMYAEFFETLGQARILGLTATPYRLASNSFGSELRFLTRTRPRIFTDVVHCTQVGDLLSDGYLSPLVYSERQTGFDPTRLRVNSTGADYVDESVQRYFQEIGFNGRLLSTVRDLLAEGRRSVLVFTRFIAEAEHLAKTISGASVVTAETPRLERERVLADFRSGRTPICANVGVLTLGFDYPELATVVLARPTMSLGLYYQMIGRAVRPHASKPYALIVDLVGLTKQFGKIEDLRLVPGGKTGAQWTINSGRRQLTNIYFGADDSRYRPAFAR